MRTPTPFRPETVARLKALSGTVIIDDDNAIRSGCETTKDGNPACLVVALAQQRSTHKYTNLDALCGHCDEVAGLTRTERQTIIAGADFSENPNRALLLEILFQ